MIYRSKAPLRIGLAGGGTDVSPYCDLYGGAILNATISLYAYATIELLQVPEVVLEAIDRKEIASYALAEELPIDGQLDLASGVYNHIVRKYGHVPSGFKLTTIVDAPAGSGLGSVGRQAATAFQMLSRGPAPGSARPRSESSAVA